jgi:hypothetical protein
MSIVEARCEPTLEDSIGPKPVEEPAVDWTATLSIL